MQHKPDHDRCSVYGRQRSLWPVLRHVGFFNCWCVYQQQYGAAALYCVKSKTRYKRRISFVAFSCMPCSFPLCHSLSLSVSPLFSRLPLFHAKLHADRTLREKEEQKKKGQQAGGGWSQRRSHGSGRLESFLLILGLVMCYTLVLVMGPYKESLAHVHGLLSLLFFYDMECVFIVCVNVDGVVVDWARICRI